jgi:hypothetical protein
MWQIFRAGSPLGYAAHMTVEKLPAAKVLARRLVGSHGKKPKSGRTVLPQAPSDEAAGS